MPQLSYSTAVGRVGQVSRTGSTDVDSYVNEIVAQVVTITIAATHTDGTYTIRIEDPSEGNIDFSFVASSDSADDLAAGLRAAAAVAAVANLLINVATVTGATDEVIVTFIHRTGVNIPVTLLSNPGGDMSSAQVDAGGSVIGLGLAVAYGSTAGTVVLPVSTVVVAGITSLDTRTQLNTGDVDQVDGTVPGQLVATLRQGTVWVNATATVVVGGLVYARNASATAAFPLGSLSSASGDGLLIPNARFVSAVTGPGLAEVQINLPG